MKPGQSLFPYFSVQRALWHRSDLKERTTLECRLGAIGHLRLSQPPHISGTKLYLLMCATHRAHTTLELPRS